MRAWTKVERSYRRPSLALALRLKFAFYPLLATRRDRLARLGLEHDSRSLNSAENAIFDHGRAVAPVRAAAVGPRGRRRDRRMLDRVFPRAGRRRLALEPAAARGPARSARSRRRAARSATTCCSPIRRARIRAAIRRSRPWLRAARAASCSPRRACIADYDAGSPLHASQAPGAFAADARSARRPDGRAAAALRRGDGGDRAPSSMSRAMKTACCATFRCCETAGDLGLAVVAAAPRDDGDGNGRRTSFAASVRPNWRREHAPAAPQRRQPADGRRCQSAAGATARDARR